MKAGVKTHERLFDHYHRLDEQGRHRCKEQFPLTHSLFTASFTKCHNLSPCSLTSSFDCTGAALTTSPSSSAVLMASVMVTSCSSDLVSLRRFERGSRLLSAVADRNARSLFDMTVAGRKAASSTYAMDNNIRHSRSQKQITCLALSFKQTNATQVLALTELPLSRATNKLLSQVILRLLSNETRNVFGVCGQ